MDPAERAAQRLISKLILQLMIDRGEIDRADAIAAFREARDRIERTSVDADTRSALASAIDNMLLWLDPRAAVLH